MTLGEKIKSKRMAAGLNRKQLAACVGCCASSVTYWEKDLRRPKYEQLLKVAEVLDIDFMEFAMEVEL